MEIRNIEQLLVPSLKREKSFLRCNQEKLLSAGENYGSTMLKADVFLNDTNGKEEVLKCVAKMVPPHGVLWHVFDTLFTFKKEIAVYNIIVPTLNSFGEEHGVNNLLPFFADYYGSRISLDPKSDTVDDDAVLLLKNAKEDGYVVCDRFVGFDIDTTTLLIKDLATIHAATIAFKLAKPSLFAEKLMPYLERSLEYRLDVQEKETHVKTFLTAVSRYPDINHLTQRMIDGYHKGMDNLARQRTSDQNPFGTVTHGDLWTNNVLVKFIDGKPVSSKFVDFQITEYGNPARDVIFLIYSSSQMNVLPFFDDLLLLYHNHFVETLRRLNCDPTPFNYENFLKEVEIAASVFEFGHLLFMLFPVFAKKGQVTELADMRNKADLLLPSDTFHENFYPRFKFVVEDFARRGWI